VPSPRKSILLIAAAGITALLAVEYLRLLRPAQAREVQAACRGLRPTVNNKVIGTVPTKAPEFTAQDHSGKMVKLSDYRGKVVVVRFWASWCETCKAEQPSLEDLAGDIDTEDAVVLSLASDASWDLVRKKLTQGSNTTVLLDPPRDEDSLIGRIAEAYGVEKVPDSFIIDRDGIIRYYLVNKRDWNGAAARTCLRSVLDS
jgi:cytochrome c biogenesis protein CcmG, thiol:disulfide interchange protein DsbE